MPFYIERGIEVTGADVSEDMLRAAEGIWKENLSSVRTDVASVLSLPYACSTFDLVVCFRLLQMVLSYDEAKSALNELARVSKRFLILELNFRPDSRVIYGLLKPDRPMANLLGKSQLFEILSDLGLEILETRRPLKGSERQGHYAILLEKRRTEVLLGD